MMTKNLNNLNENFCEDLFWDQNLTWYNASNGPKFTKCFKNVVVVFPIGFFWLILIPWSFWIFPKNSRPKKSLSWNFLTKQLFTVGIIALYIVDLADKFNQLYTLNGSDILYYVISISTMVMAMIVLTIGKLCTVPGKMLNQKIYVQRKWCGFSGKFCYCSFLGI